MTQVPPRILPLPREEWTETAKDVFSYWEGPEAREKGSCSNFMMTLARHPQLAFPSLDFSKYLHGGASLTDRQREIVILRVVRHWKSPVQWTNHVPIAGQAGITDAEIEALQSDKPSPIWDEADRVLIAAIDQVCSEGQIDDATWKGLAASMSELQLIDFIYLAGFYTMSAWAFVVLGIEQGGEAENWARKKRIG